MILSKAGKLALLAGLMCLLLMVFSGASYGAIRWEVVSAPTEVINSGRSEVLGSITLTVEPGQGTVSTGNVAGGPAQIGILYNNNMQIDNTTVSTSTTLNTSPTGVRAGIYRQFVSGAVLITTILYSFPICPNSLGCITVQNFDITGTGNFAGLITLNMPQNMLLQDNDFVRVDGVRGRIDLSDLSQPNRDASVKLQSINDPSANQFTIDIIRVATSFLPMNVAVTSAQAVFCLPPFGAPNGAFLHPPSSQIRVTENFNRAFVARDSGATNLSSGVTALGPDFTDRLDTQAQILGQPTNGTMLKVYLTNIPASITSISWPAQVFSAAGGGAATWFQLQNGTTSGTPCPAGGTGIQGTCFSQATAGVVTPPAGTAFAVYEYFTTSQAGISDISLEQFDFRPELTLSVTNLQDIVPSPWLGIRAGASLWPSAETVPTQQPNSSSSANNTSASSPAMPRFVTLFLSNAGATSTAPGVLTDSARTTFGIYETFSPCVCYLLFPFATRIPGAYDTGIAIANTSDDSGAIAAALGAPKQAGTITLWLYDWRLGNLAPNGVFYTDLGGSGRPPHIANTTGPAFDANNQPIYYAGQTLRFVLGELFTGSSNPLVTKLATDPAGARTDFSGYIIAKANFQFCHGFAFVGDAAFANVAQGYIANVIPDPAVKGPRSATAAADVIVFLKAGESLNN
jgi:hypothetical protein